MVAPGALERFLAVGELLGSFLLHVRALGTVGHVEGPRAFTLGRRLDAEVAEAPHGLLTRDWRRAW